MLTHGLSDNWGFNREMFVDGTRQMYEKAVQRSDAIERISTSVQELVKTEQRILHHGIQCLEPGVVRFEVIEDPGSIKDIAGIFNGSSNHITEQLRRLGRSTVYKMCRYMYDIQTPLEKTYVAIRRWNETENEKYNEWRSLDPSDLVTTRELTEANRCVRNLVRDQLKLLRSLKDNFTNAMDADGGKLMHLLAYCANAQLVVKTLMTQKQLERDDATVEAGENALRETIHPRVNAHRSTNVPLVEHFESITALSMCEILVEFRAKVQREKENIEIAIGVEQSGSGF